MGRDTGSPIDQRRHRRGQLDRRNLERLAEGYGRQLYRPYVLLGMHNRCRLPWQVNPRPGEKPKLLEVFIEIVDSQPLPQFNKDGVAGIHDPMRKILRAMPCPLVAMDPPVLDQFIAWAEKLVIQAYDPLF